MILVTTEVVETTSTIEEGDKIITSLKELRIEKKVKGMTIKILFKIGSNKTADLGTIKQVELLNKNTQNKNLN